MNEEWRGSGPQPLLWGLECELVKSTGKCKLIQIKLIYLNSTKRENVYTSFTTQTLGRRAEVGANWLPVVTSPMAGVCPMHLQPPDVASP